MGVVSRGHTQFKRRGRGGRGRVGVSRWACPLTPPLPQRCGSAWPCCWTPACSPSAARPAARTATRTPCGCEPLNGALGVLALFHLSYLGALFDVEGRRRRGGAGLWDVLHHPQVVGAALGEPLGHPGLLAPGAAAALSPRGALGGAGGALGATGRALGALGGHWERWEDPAAPARGRSAPPPLPPEVPLYGSCPRRHQ
ncbi:uncharacterized protein LOC127465196 isoform X2 [Manacus candei]|nr:uncharacterized protein LOC127465196 isoform X2 [Manacus candei]